VHAKAALVLRRDHASVGAEHQVVGDGVGAEHLELVGVVVRQQAVLIVGQTDEVVQHGRTGVGLSVVRQDGAFVVTLAFRQGVRPLQAPLAVERALEGEFQRDVFALRGREAQVGLREGQLLGQGGGGGDRRASKTAASG
jgi:hypothetical protein